MVQSRRFIVLETICVNITYFATGFEKRQLKTPGMALWEYLRVSLPLISINIYVF